jgi:hypothetical protein
VTARLGLDGMQSGHKSLYWFGQECPYVQWVLLLLVLPCTGVLVVGVTSLREMERIPGLLGGVCVHLISEVISFPPPRCGLCLPFYSSQEEGSGYICGKKVKWRKDEREKNKKGGLGCGGLPPYPV